MKHPKSTKTKCLSERKPGMVIYTVGNYGAYRLANSYEDLLVKIKTDKSPIYFEYIDANDPVVLFFDIDIKQPLFGCSTLLASGEEALRRIRRIVGAVLPEYEKKFYLLTSHLYDENEMKKFSAHVIIRIFKDDTEYLWTNTTHLIVWIKTIFRNEESGLIDYNVYKSKGYLFRTIYSSKEKNEGIRPLVKEDFHLYETKDSDSILYFVGYFDIKKVKLFSEDFAVKKAQSSPKRPLEYDEEISICPFKKDILERVATAICAKHNLTLVSIYSLTTAENNSGSYFISYKGDCPVLKKPHKSNNCWIKIDKYLVIIGCHDNDCKAVIKASSFDSLYPETYNSLFGPEDYIITHHLYPYLRKIDDVTDIDLSLEKNAYIAAISPRIESKYKDFTGGMHILKPLQHIISKDGVDVEVPDFCEQLTNQLYNIIIRDEPIQSTQQEKFSKIVVNAIVVWANTFKDKDNQMYEHIIRFSETFSIYDFVQVQLLYLGKGKLKFSGTYFYLWTGKIWYRLDTERQFKGRISITTAKIFTDIRASNCGGPANSRLISALSRHETQFIQAHINSIINMISDIVIEPNFVSELNMQWGFIPFENGMYELETGILHEHDIKNRFSFTFPWEYSRLANHYRILNI